MLSVSYFCVAYPSLLEGCIPECGLHLDFITEFELRSGSLNFLQVSNLQEQYLCHGVRILVCGSVQQLCNVATYETVKVRLIHLCHLCTVRATDGRILRWE